ncbi:MAG: nuclear transport factor 2 family protein [Rhodococcus sp.]|uniref:nuclear transport factor 2 family protein n=1 Tax=Rhodococcus TaxID=1827 RepID=UPI0016A50C15|nr:MULTISPECIES: nuclear transport factor 2 family protein [Rhodococcus]NLV78745.1 nuclear transport factor 2 family protein [Rhodococcus sp. (in: high G+C Gram-positive bacteria)]
MSTSEIATVLAWHDAVNSNDIDTLVELSSDDIVLPTDDDDPDQGLDELREWATTSGVTLEPGRMFVHAGIVVVEERSTWAADPQNPVDEAIAFRVVDDQVVTVVRHPRLTDAFEATGLGEGDLYEE